MTIKMPQAVGTVHINHQGAWALLRGHVKEDDNLYTAEALREVLEQAALECDASAKMYADLANGGDNSGGSDHRQIAASELAAAIRAMKEQIK